MVETRVAVSFRVTAVISVASLLIVNNCKYRNPVSYVLESPIDSLSRPSAKRQDPDILKEFGEPRPQNLPPRSRTISAILYDG